MSDKFDKLYIDFVKDLNFSSEFLASSVENYKDKANLKKKHYAYESAYLKMFLAYEYFIEKTFTYYMLGEKTQFNYNPKLLIKTKNEDHVYKLYLGKELDGRDYIQWSDMKLLGVKANIFWDETSNPFNNLNSTSPDFKYMRILRNAISHKSSFHKKTLVEVEENYFTTVENLDAGEILEKILIRNDNKPLIHFFKKKFQEYGKTLLISPT